MKIAICEDDSYTNELIYKMVEKHLNANNISFVINSFHTASAFFSSPTEYDLYLLDCELPDSNGLEIAKRIRQTNKKGTIVFITSYIEYVFKSFEVNTFRYLMKPLSEDELNTTLDAFINNYERYAKIEVPLTSGVTFISVHEIMYIESNGRYSTVRTNNNTYISTKPISAFQAEINSYKFFRTHRTFFVNMKYISDINGHIITLINGEKIEISRRNLSTFNKSYMNFLKYSDL